MGKITVYVTDSIVYAADVEAETVAEAIAKVNKLLEQNSDKFPDELEELREVVSGWAEVRESIPYLIDHEGGL